MGFSGENGQYELLTTDILNLGVFPDVLLTRARKRFEEAGGVVRELCPVSGMTVHPNGVAVAVEGTGER